MPRGRPESGLPGPESGVRIESSRFSCRSAHEMLGRLGRSKRELVRSVGFGSLFDIPNLKRTDRQLSVWLLDCWDTTNNVLRIDCEHEIPITAADVCRVLGIPNGPLPVTGVDKFERFLSSIRVRKILGITERSPMLSMRALEDLAVSTNVETEDGKERFLAAFLCFMVANVLAPRCGYQRVQPEVFPAVSCPLRSKEFNWCHYVLDELRASAEKVKHSLAERHVAPVHGCILALQVLYWDSLPVCRSLVPDGPTPRAPLYTREIITMISKLDTGLTKINKCRAFFEGLPPTQNRCNDGRRRKRVAHPSANDLVVGQGPIVGDAFTLGVGPPSGNPMDANVSNPHLEQLAPSVTATRSNSRTIAASSAATSSSSSSAGNTSVQQQNFSVCQALLNSSPRIGNTSVQQQNLSVCQALLNSSPGIGNTSVQQQNLSVCQALLNSSPGIGNTSVQQTSNGIPLHSYGGQPAVITKITCSNWPLVLHNPRLGPYVDPSASLSFWIEKNDESSKYYWDWIVHADHRTVVMTGVTIRDLMLNLSPISHDVCEMAMRVFRNCEKSMCSRSTCRRPCRHFLSADWGRFVLCGVLPRTEDHFGRMFSVDDVTYSVSHCQMVTTLIELDKQWCCYCWDFSSRRLTIIDPQVGGSPSDEVRARHYKSSPLFHSHLLMCMDAYTGKKRKDVSDWEILLLQDVVPAPNRDMSALYSLYYALEFDGAGIRVAPTDERIADFRTALLYQIIHVDGNAGNLPAIISEVTM